MKLEKTLATDLDGTLFYPKRRIRMVPEKSVRFVHRFVNDGGRFVTISSRGEYFAKKLAERLGNPMEAVCNNGALVFSGGKCIKEAYLEPGLAEKIIADVKKECGYHVAIVSTRELNSVYDPKDTTLWTDFVYAVYNRILQGVYHEPVKRSKRIFDEQLAKNQVTKILIIVGFSKKKHERAYKFTKKLNEKYDNAEFSWVETGIEVSPKGCTKAAGLLFYLDYNKIPRDNVLVVGDGGNDISMFDAFPDSSYCLSHGPGRVKKHAAHVIDQFCELEEAIYPSEEKRL